MTENLPEPFEIARYIRAQLIKVRGSACFLRDSITRIQQHKALCRPVWKANWNHLEEPSILLPVIEQEVLMVKIDQKNVVFGVRKAVKRAAAVCLLLLLSSAFLTAAGHPESSQEPDAEESVMEAYNIAVFIPGVTAGSPIYEMLAEGAEKAAADYPHVDVNIIEGGFNQGEWQAKLSSIAAAGKHNLIVTSNPAMPEICSKISERFPNQKFLIFDGELSGNPNIYTLRYNQYQQAYIAGYLAGLVTSSSMEYANDEKKIGLIAGQEYPDMNQSILPGYTDGAEAAAGSISVDFRVVGNWFDASKSSELAREMIKDGADVLLPISGGANQGVLKVVKELDAYTLWYDSDGYDLAPGHVIGSTTIRQDKAAYEKIKLAVEGKLPFGTAETAGIEGKWITFIDDNPLYAEHVPETIRQKLQNAIDDMK